MNRHKSIVLIVSGLALTAATMAAAHAGGISIIDSTPDLFSGAGPLSLMGMGLGAIGSIASTGTENHATQTKFFRIALEGATTDGRNIARDWITQMAKNYNPDVYGARLNLEHIRGIVPDGPFKAYGDVLALEAREETGELAGKLGLYAQIAPTDDLVAMTKAKQKIYTSCEIDPSFADTKQAYLVGLAVTDNPASLGTSILSFAAQNPADSLFAARKQGKDNLFSAAVDAEFELEEVAPPKVSLFTKVAELLGRVKNKATADETRFTDVSEAVEALAKHGREHSDLVTAQAGTIEKLGQQVVDLTAQGKADRDALEALKVQLSNASNGQPPRPAATGSSGTVATDC